MIHAKGPERTYRPFLKELATAEGFARFLSKGRADGWAVSLSREEATLRKLLILLVAASAAASMVQANARDIQKKTVTLTATPCLVALCPYWQPHASDPTVAVTANISTADNQKESAFACTEPGPSQFYRDVVVTAPAGAKLLVARYKPSVDWDVWICGKPKNGDNGPMLARESGAGSDVTVCQESCPSYVSTKVKPGVKYVLRAYNFSDYDSLKLTYVFSG